MLATYTHSFVAFLQTRSINSPSLSSKTQTTHQKLVHFDRTACNTTSYERILNNASNLRGQSLSTSAVFSRPDSQTRSMIIWFPVPHCCWCFHRNPRTEFGSWHQSNTQFDRPMFHVSPNIFFRVAPCSCPFHIPSTLQPSSKSRSLKKLHASHTSKPIDVKYSRTAGSLIFS